MPSHSALSTLFYFYPGRQEGIIIHTLYKGTETREVKKCTQAHTVISHPFLLTPQLPFSGFIRKKWVVNGGFLSSIPLQVSVKRMRPPHRAQEDPGVHRGRTDPQIQGKCDIKVRTTWVMPGPDTPPLFLLLLYKSLAPVFTQHSYPLPFGAAWFKSIFAQINS